MVNFYNRFLPHAAHIMHPLYGALRGKKSKDELDWTSEMDEAFTAAKSALADAALLAHPSPAAPIALTTDASDYAVGAVCEQWVNGGWQPLAFFSKQLRENERKYSTFDRELLGLFLATRHFRFLLEGRRFTAFVDHKPLTFCMAKTSEPWSGRQQRHLSAVSEFTTDIQHVSGKDNFVADCLSRAVANSVHLGLDYAAMAADQARDTAVQDYRSTPTALRLEDVTFDAANATLLCDVSTGQPRPLVPTSWRRRVFDTVHGLSHPGVKASTKLVSVKFVWPGLRKDVRAWASSCVACQRAKVHRHTKAPLAPFVVPERRFDHLNVDLVGPLPPSRGYTHLLTIVDRATRWPEAIPLSSTTAAEVARAFIGCWVARFGTPGDISSDRGSQFTSELWTEVAGHLGMKIHRTTAYNPQSNGLCERFHRDMKAALRASLTGCDWVDRLPWVMLGLRSAPKEDLQASAAELVYGQPLRVPGEFLPEATTPWSPASHLSAARGAAGAFAPVPTSRHCLPQTYVPKDLPSARYVFIRHDSHRSPLQPPYDGPFRVLEAGEKNFVVDMGGRPERVAIDRLKPAHLDIGDPVQVALPPRRGRPPRSPPEPASLPDPAPLVARAPTVRRSRYGRRIRPPSRREFSC